MTVSDILMDKVYPIFRQLEKLKWKNESTKFLKSIEFNFNQGSIKFTYNK